MDKNISLKYKQNKNGIIFVAIYVRVSTEEQVKFGFSIQAQIDALVKYCNEHNYKYEIFIDEGISASTMKRPALQRILSKIEQFDMVLFTKLDRLSRNVLDANTINQILKENKCVMKAIDEDDVDTSTADGTFIFNLKVSLAQREIGKTSERIKFIFESKRQRGEVTSGTRKYGYNIVNKHFEINEEEANNIRKLYKEYINNNGNLKETYNYFVDHFPNKGYDAMSNYLKDSAYIGKYKLYRQNKYLDNYIPAILDLKTWEKVQTLRTRKTIERKHNYIDLFSGLLYCSVCGHRLSKHIDYRVKNPVARYECFSVNKFKVNSTERVCNNNKTIRESKIETFLLNNLNNSIANFVAKVSIEQSSIIKKDNSQQLKRIQTKINKLKDLYLDDLIDKDSYKKDFEKYQQELANLKESEILEVPKRDLSHLNNILNSDYKTIYNNLNTKNKKKFWLSIIDKIYIENGEIQEVTFL
mgnify:CR=1 FL=1